MVTRPSSLEQNLQTCLEVIESGEETLEMALARIPGATEELREGLEAADWIQRHASSLDPRPGFMRDARHHLVKEIGSPAIALAWRRLSCRLRIAFRGLCLLLLVLTLFNAGYQVVLASQVALPGDGLYPAKRLWEEAHLAVTLGKGERAALSVWYARERTTEIQELVLEGRYADIRLAARLYENQVLRASRSLAVLREVDPALERDLEAQLMEALNSQVVILAALLGSVPENYRQGVQQVMQVTLR